ncbi:hypothetical protein K439DRAFT_1616411 [Ramaria rubella]|nr:hypothetical protein K439DRAFT_1616411 [Ramaria rubella]
MPKNLNSFRPYCDQCHGRDMAVKICAGCKGTSYCSKSCQELHWPLHKDICRSLRQQRHNIRSTAPDSYALVCEATQWSSHLATMLARAAVSAFELMHSFSMLDKYAIQVSLQKDEMNSVTLNGVSKVSLDALPGDLVWDHRAWVPVKGNLFFVVDLNGVSLVRTIQLPIDNPKLLPYCHAWENEFRKDFAQMMEKMKHAGQI